MPLTDRTFTPVLRFADELLMPLAEIESAQQRLEDAGTAALVEILENETESLLRRAETALTDRDLPALLALQWPAAGMMARAIVRIWAEGFGVGAEHGLQEMRAAVEDLAPVAMARRFALADDMAQVLTLEAAQLINTDAVEAVLGRANMLAGNFADDTFNLLRQDLIAAITPQPGTGEPISRAVLLERIQKTLGVGANRADIIARTESTYAMNTGRLNSYRQSELVDYLRFNAIADSRVTDICRSRAGMIFSKDDAATLQANTPPLHPRCRSVLSPVMSRLSRFQESLADPNNNPANRTLAPLPTGWRTGAATPAATGAATAIAPEAVPSSIDPSSRAIYQQAIDGKQIALTKDELDDAEFFLIGADSDKVDRIRSANPTITEAEARATAKYIGTGYGDMSKRVYAPTAPIDAFPDPHTAKDVDVANRLFGNALQKMPPVTEARINSLAAQHPSAIAGRAPELYDASRGLTRGITLDGQALDDLVERHQQALTKGGGIRQDTWFASTTMNLDDVAIARESNVIFRIQPRLDGTGQGRYIDHFKNGLVEGEVMFPAYSKFDVTDIRVQPGQGVALTQVQQTALEMSTKIQDYKDLYGSDWKTYWGLLEPGKTPTVKQIKAAAEAAEAARNYRPPIVEIFLRE